MCVSPGDRDMPRQGPVVTQDGAAAALGGEADGAALQADLQAVGGGGAAVPQESTVQPRLAGVLGAARLPRKLRAVAAAQSPVAALSSAHAARQAVPQDRTHGQHLAEQAGQDEVDAAVCRDSRGDSGRSSLQRHQRQVEPMKATVCRNRDSWSH